MNDEHAPDDEMVSLERVLEEAGRVCVHDDAEPRACDLCGTPYVEKCERCAARRHAVALAERTIPTDFDWARVGASELAQRVRVTRRALDVAHRWALEHEHPELAASLKRDADATALASCIARASWVVLQGPSGAGKTSLAIAALRIALEAEPNGVRFVDGTALGTARIQHPAGHGEAPLETTAKRARLLLLDELKADGTKTDAVPDVIRERRAWRRPTWFTTPWTPDELRVSRGDDISRRVYERALWLPFGDD